MKKSSREALIVAGLVGAGAVGYIVWKNPKAVGLSTGTRSYPQPFAAGIPPNHIRMILTGIPNQKYSVTARAMGGAVTAGHTELVNNKVYTIERHGTPPYNTYGTLSVDLQVPAPSSVTITWTEMKTGRKITQDVPVDPTQVPQQVLFEFATQEGRFR